MDWTHPYNLDVDNTYEVNGGCYRSKYLIYADSMRIVPRRDAGTAAYRLTLYDMLLNNLTCVQVDAKSTARTPVTLWWMTYLDKAEGTAFGPYPETPESLLKIIPPKSRKPPITEGDGRWIPKDHLEPRLIEDPNDTLDIININLLIKLFFVHEAQLNVKVYGIPKYVPTTTTTTTTEAVTSATQNISDIANNLYETYNFQHAEIFETLNLPRRRREYRQEGHPIGETPEPQTHQFNNYNDLEQVDSSEWHWDHRYDDKYTPESYTSEPESQLQRGYVKRDQDSDEERNPKHQSKTFNDLHHTKPPLPHQTPEKYRHYKEENIPESRLSGPRIMLWPKSYRDKDQDNVGYKRKTHKPKHQFNIFKDPYYSNISLRHEKYHYSKGVYRPESGLPKQQLNTNSEKDYDSKEGNKNETHKPKHRFKTFNSRHHSNVTPRQWSAEKDHDYRPGETNKKERSSQHSLIWPRGSIKGHLTPKRNNRRRHNPKGSILQNDQGYNNSRNSYGRRLRSRRRQDLDSIPHQKLAQGQNVGTDHHHIESLTQKPQIAYEIEKNKGSKENPFILRLEDY